jgi:hypothetical protein
MEGIGNGSLNPVAIARAMILSIFCLMGGACLGYLIAAIMAATR